MLKMMKISDVFNLSVYTEEGEFFGTIEESIITANKVYGWRIKATKNSTLSRVLGGAKGVIVPHQHVKSIGDIMIVNKAVVPKYGEEEEV